MSRARRIVVACVLWAAAAVPLRGHAPHDEVHAVALSPNFAADGFVAAVLQLTEHRVIGVSWDRGATWTEVAGGVTAMPVHALDASPSFAVDRALVAGTDDGAWISRDAGLTWERLGGPALVGVKVLDVRFSPAFANDRALLAATEIGVLRSTDGGLTWTRPVGAPAGAAERVRFGAGLPPVAYALAGGLHRSVDGGQTWSPVAGPQPLVTELAVDPGDAAGQTLLVASRGGNGASVDYSQDGGQTWHPMIAGLTDPVVTGLEIAPGGTCLAIARQAACFVAPALGQPWVLHADGFEDLAPQSDDHYHALAVTTTFATDGVAFVGGHEGLFRSDDGGQTWVECPVYHQRIHRLLEVSPDFAADGEVWFGNYGGGPFRFASGSKAWTATGHGVFSLWCGALALSPTYAVDRTLFYGYAGLWRSSDGGETWEKLVSGPPIVRGVALSPAFAVDRTLFANFAEAGTKVSSDGGQSWQPVAALPAVKTDPIVLSPAFPIDGVMFAAPQWGGLLRSSDGGQTFTDVSPLPPPIEIQTLALSPGFAHDGVAFAGTVNKGLFRSSDGGQTWTKIPLPPGPTDGTIESLSVSPAFAQDGTVFAVDLFRGLLRSKDGGFTFAPSNQGLPPDVKRRVRVTPTYASDRTVYLTTHAGAYVSHDSGLTWLPLPGYHRTDDKHPTVFHSGAWTQSFSPKDFGGQVRVASQAGAAESFQFEGSRVVWRARTGPSYGVAEVFVDGLSKGLVDLYSPVPRHDFAVFQASFGAVSVHTVEVRVLGQRNPASSGVEVASDGFEVRY